MTVCLIACADIPPEPWKNGGGVTRTLLTDGDPFRRWRISVADIDVDGQFSRYPGIERWLAVAKGDGVILDIDGTRYQLDRASAPLRFSGDSIVDCRLLGGTTRDLNLMLRGVGGRMVRASPNMQFAAGSGSCGLFATIPVRCVGQAIDIEMPAFSLAWFTGGEAGGLHFTVSRPDSREENDFVGYWIEIEDDPS